MNTNTSSINAADLTLSPNNKGGKFQTLLLFSVGKLNLALPIESVQKISRYTDLQGSGTTSVGLLHIDNQEITAIDLHKRLFKVSQALASQAKPFIILARNSLKESFAIVVEKTPTLMDIPLSKIRVLPDSYRQADTLDMASHVTMIQQEDQTLTVFIVDCDRLLSRIS
ncbi:CheW protein [Rippkaea orientalis PCC 8801]|uniref:CheW protein n=1 Tax=Rippkaea orientalis (strain PCC 8801 / RF-1) TaxID=41431 RepID=B7JZA2_RIPO1|nr:chemotaxis protein CheW [Rippkaea orientalis]ACK67313.1 CheW protein [Rippkaea orientalis PCC 8801]